MSDKDEVERLAEQKAREAAEAAVISNRISELHEEPIEGKFDAEHLKAIHAYIFDGYPEHQPGVVREDTPGWIKTRVLEGGSDSYVVHYASKDIEAKIAKTLDQFGGPEAIKGLTADAASGQLAGLYGDLDHAHGFYEGNSRTLREFTRELAKEAGFNLDWTGTSVGAEQRNELYMARDLAVMERAFPDLTPAKAMQTNDRLEFEASFVVGALRNDVGERSLEAIIRGGLSPDMQLEQARQPELSEAARTETVAAAPMAETNQEPGYSQSEAHVDPAAATAGSLEAATEVAASPVESAAAAALDGIAGMAGSVIDRIATAFESLLGGGSSALEQTPQPELSPKEARAAARKASLAAEEQQRASTRQELANRLGASQAMTDQELSREETEQQRRSRDGGITR